MEVQLASFLARLIPRIRVGGITLFWRQGRVCACSSRRPHCSGENWEHTLDRDQSTGKFAGNRQHGSHVKDVYAGLPVWKCALAETGLTGRTSDNFRQSVNNGYVGAGGKVTDFRHFTVSQGQLLLPLSMTVETEGDKVTLRWDDKRDIPSARPGDRLHVFFIRASVPDSLQRVPRMIVTRGRGEASFILPDRENDTYHVYPFFGTKAHDVFSRNEYFKV